VSEAFVIRDSSVMPVSRYVVLLMDADTFELLDYTHTEGVDLQKAYKLAASLARCIAAGKAVKHLGAPLEVDAVFEGGHVKILFDVEAGLIRALVDEITS